VTGPDQDTRVVALVIRVNAVAPFGLVAEEFSDIELALAEVREWGGLLVRLENFEKLKEAAGE
jgi:hypothetical protein